LEIMVGCSIVIHGSCDPRFLCLLKVFEFQICVPPTFPASPNWQHTAPFCFDGKSLKFESLWSLKLDNIFWKDKVSPVLFSKQTLYLLMFVEQPSSHDVSWCLWKIPVARMLADVCGTAR
jgi:hypothetical protein